MKKLKGSRTEHNLMAAFAGESQARNRYTFYAGIAFEGRARGDRRHVSSRRRITRRCTPSGISSFSKGWTWRSRPGTLQDRSTAVNL